MKFLPRILQIPKSGKTSEHQRRTFIRWKKEKDKFKWFEDCQMKECKERPECTQPPDFLRKIKMKLVEGGTNFGTPFRRVKCPVTEDPKQTKPAVQQPKAEEPEAAAGVQVTLLGANTILGHNLAVLLKQVPEIKR
ncbi:hypothetical protein EVAR_38134_1 [Eumeta japonica]|uniref:Uncharacterized protein n=1 Tax=Eumeta variegata TaxID=151549 RepID=A0A4C1YM85_EUMVA|nr:hypothetical protein EVAR_38134_1 [Eumeta japonica]